MKVGDYVRTKEFGISRVKWFDNNEPILENGFTALQKEYKLSPNIIDLIEVGDYVNGYPVEKIYQPINEKLGKIVRFATDNASGWEYEAEEIYEKDIKTIVTKEQFESMQYKIGE